MKKNKQKLFAELIEIMKAETANHEGYILQQGTTTQWHQDAKYWPFILSQLQPHDYDHKTGLGFGFSPPLKTSKAFILDTFTGKVICISDIDLPQKSRASGETLYGHHGQENSEDGFYSIAILENRNIICSMSRTIHGPNNGINYYQIISFIQTFDKDLNLSEPTFIKQGDNHFDKIISSPVLSTNKRWIGFLEDKSPYICNLTTGICEFIGFYTNINQISYINIYRHNGIDIICAAAVFAGRNSDPDQGVMICRDGHHYLSSYYAGNSVSKIAIIPKKGKTAEVKVGSWKTDLGSYIIPPNSKDWNEMQFLGKAWRYASSFFMSKKSRIIGTYILFCC